MTIRNVAKVRKNHLSHEKKFQKRRDRASAVWGPIAIIAAMALCFTIALGTADAFASKSAGDFVKKAAVGNEFEIESSQLALQKSQNDDVRTFAQRMIDDHTKAGQDLQTALSSSSSDVPPPDKTLDAKHQRMMAKLNNANGADFDKLYVKIQSKAHDDTVSMFKDYAKHGDDPSLKNFAAQTLPTLEDHQHEIHGMKSAM